MKPLKPSFEVEALVLPLLKESDGGRRASKRRLHGVNVEKVDSLSDCLRHAPPREPRPKKIWALQPRKSWRTLFSSLPRRSSHSSSPPTHTSHTFNMAPTPTVAKKNSKKGAASGGKGIKFVKGENFYRDAKGARRVKLLSKNGIASKAIRNAKGKIVQAQEFQSTEVVPGRIQPDRRWFGECMLR